MSGLSHLKSKTPAANSKVFVMKRPKFNVVARINGSESRAAAPSRSDVVRQQRERGERAENSEKRDNLKNILSFLEKWVFLR